jgi:hypothetical protein
MEAPLKLSKLDGDGRLDEFVKTSGAARCGCRRATTLPNWGFLTPVIPASLELAPYSFTGSGSARDADVSKRLRLHTDWAAIAVR